MSQTNRRVLRQTKLSKVKTKRIFKIRDYGLILLANKYAVSIQRTTFNKANVLALTSYIYQQLQNGLSLQNIEDTIYKIPQEKLDKFTKDTSIIFKVAFDKGADKLTDVTGAKVEIRKPSYNTQINELVEDNLKYVKDLNDAQKKKVIDELSKGMKQGKTYSEMAEEIAKNVKELTKQRAYVISRTEVVRATATSMEKAMLVNGFKTYYYLTAGDNRVSEICKINSFGNKEGTGPLIKHIVGQGPIPVVSSHPQCRCSLCKGPD